MSGKRRGIEWAPVLLALFWIALLSGAVGAPFASDEVPFEALQRQHFDALSVKHEHGSVTDQLLVLRVHILGDPGTATVAEASAWLLTNARIRLIDDPAGAPLYLTQSDLSATSGRATVGAAVTTGMAVEIRNPVTAPCVLVHEALHFVGLKHTAPGTNIMSPHCASDGLARATIEPDQLSQVAKLHAIRAVTPRGAETWAVR